MKTFGIKSISTGDIKIGISYYEDGRWDETIEPKIDALGVDNGLLSHAQWTIENCYDGDADLVPIVIDATTLPGNNGFAFDKTFIGAFRHSAQSVSIDVPAAKLIAHDKRRARREALLAPHDKLATSPVTAIKNAANAAKQAILDADSPVQASIDSATTPEELKTILSNYGAL